MAVHTNDVALLLSSSCRGKFCENLPMKIISITPFTKKSTYPNRLLQSYGKALAKVVKKFEYVYIIFVFFYIGVW